MGQKVGLGLMLAKCELVITSPSDVRKNLNILYLQPGYRSQDPEITDWYLNDYTNANGAFYCVVLYKSDFYYDIYF